MAANGPACVKTQKRSHVVFSKLDCISGEVGYCWKGVIGFEGSQLRDTLHLTTTFTDVCHQTAVVFSHGLGRKLSFTNL